MSIIRKQQLGPLSMWPEDVRKPCIDRCGLYYADLFVSQIPILAIFIEKCDFRASVCRFCHTCDTGVHIISHNTYWEHTTQARDANYCEMLIRYTGGKTAFFYIILTCTEPNHSVQTIAPRFNTCFSAIPTHPLNYPEELGTIHELHVTCNFSTPLSGPHPQPSK